MDSIVLESERKLRVSAAEARAVIVRSLRIQQFTLTTEQVSMLAAKRGSQIVGSVQPKKLPVTVKVMLQPMDQGCTVKIRLADAWHSGVGKVWGMNGPYRSLLGDIQMAIDEALAPIAEDDFAEGALSLATNDVAGLSAANAGLGKAGGAVVDAADQLLTPANHHVTTRSLDAVLLRSSKGVAAFDRMDVEGLLTVGLLVSSKPGAMPANLARDVERLTTRVEGAVAAQPAGRITLELEDPEIPVAEFLARQATVRETLPLRMLHVCTTCKFEKVVNPDYEKLQEKNERKRIITGAVGATITKHGISPFVLVGSLMKLKNFDIPFVCPRCQGLDADSSIVTYCPNCGQRRDEVVLRKCARCNHDFSKMPSGEPMPIWGPDVPTPPPPPVTPVAAPIAPPAAQAPAPSPPPPAPPVAAPPPAPPVAAPPPPAPFAAPAVRTQAAPLPPAGWRHDPTHRHEHRYWDGSKWTHDVANGGVPAQDPLH